ncbi:riboflavin biosynthesis protein [Tepiditoga spiralis]|uniref:Riboflavin biosynthesis protein n=1 Tax=Tepiditoga spiralis TaxID=2108365 RepID=A0A7G1G7V5_9BACT|nr:riboflavin biosynthesis protein RibF [Tepiditoga spiralis]BBE30983.1 riboflavin biosynthesis protein [Tepiditoga spiralis]
MYALTIGTFDGIHRGHKYILKKTLQIAKENNLKPLAIMLKYPIGKYLNGFDGLILPSWERKRLIEEMGFEVKIIEMKDVWHINHEDYLNHLIDIGTKYIVCGEDFKFGKGAMGDVSYLLTSGVKKGLIVEVLHDLKEMGNRVSSTLIRKNLKKGNIKESNKLLEKNWTVEGTVYEDRHVGFSLGFPTANINIREKEDIIFPKYGVYLTKGYIDGYSRILWGLTSVGIRPTYFEEIKIPKTETYFLDFFGDLYGKHIKLEFIDFLRTEEKFNDQIELIRKISKDEDNARALIESLTKN